MTRSERDHSSLLASVVSLALHEKTLGGRLSLKAASVATYLVELIDREIGVPIAAAGSREELERVVAEKRRALIQAVGGLGLVVASDLGPHVLSILKELSGALRGTPRFVEQLPPDAQGLILESLHTFSRLIARLLRAPVSPEVLEPFLGFVAGFVAIAQPKHADVTLLAAFCRDQANRLGAQLGPLAKASEKSSVAHAEDEDLKLSRALVQFWNDRGDRGATGTP